MHALKNKVQLIGNLGKAPEIINTESGKKLARFSLATNESYRNAKGEKITETTWHHLVAWGKVAEIAEKYLTKQWQQCRIPFAWIPNENNLRTYPPHSPACR